MKGERERGKTSFFKMNNVGDMWKNKNKAMRRIQIIVTSWELEREKKERLIVQGFLEDKVK